MCSLVYDVQPPRTLKASVTSCASTPNLPRPGLAVPALKEALRGEPIDVLLIDGDHHRPSVLHDFHAYAGFVRPGGAILLDDYRDAKFSPGVAQAVRLLQASGVCGHNPASGGSRGSGGAKPPHSFTCLGDLPNVANATTTCAYSPAFWRTIARALHKDRAETMRAACEAPPPALSNEFVMIRREDGLDHAVGAVADG